MKKIFLLFFALCLVSFSRDLSQIQESGVVKIGVYKGQPPFSQQTDRGFEGFEISFATRIAQDIFSGAKGKLELIGLDPQERISALENDKVDILIATFTITDDRKKRVDVSTPYFSVNIGVLTNKNDHVKTLADLEGHPIIVQSGTTADEFFTSKGFNIIRASNANEAYKMLKQRKGFAFADDNLVVMAYPVVDSDTEVVLKTLGQTSFLGIGVKKGNSTLLEFLNNEIIKLSKEEFFKKAYEDTFVPFYKGAAEKKYFLLDDLYKILM